MPRLRLLCRSATTFSPRGDLDEEALRLYLQRIVDARLGVYVGSGGSGEGHALSPEELQRVYRTAVAVCKGKVPINANIPEHHTARVTIERALQAADAGVDVVNIYGPASWHGYRPTNSELAAYFDAVLENVKHPVALAPHPVIGYVPQPALIASICDKYHQVTAVNLLGLPSEYFVQLQDDLQRDVDLYVSLASAVELGTLGAVGILSTSANILPETHRRYLDHLECGEMAELGTAYGEITRFSNYVAKWEHATPRWLKTAMKVFRLPGWEGGVRAPYRLIEGDEFRAFTDGLRTLGIREIDELFAVAGL